jgi:hypothetical protein
LFERIEEPDHKIPHSLENACFGQQNIDKDQAEKDQQDAGDHG